MMNSRKKVLRTLSVQWLANEPDRSDQADHGNLFNQIDFKLPGFDVENLTARETSIQTFICPTDHWSQDNFVVRDESISPVERYAAASYCANWGPATADWNLDATPDESKDPFYRNSQTRHANITDGTSSTIAIGERTNGPIFDTDGTPIGVPPHPNFENVWFAAIRDIDAADDDHVTWFCLTLSSDRIRLAALVQTVAFRRLTMAWLSSHSWMDLSTRFRRTSISKSIELCHQ